MRFREFKATGLPAGDPLVYAAWDACIRNAGEEDLAVDIDIPVSSALYLREHAGAGAELMCAALLRTQPDSLRGITERRFGENVVSWIDETKKYFDADFAGVRNAPDPVKLNSLAHAIATFDFYMKAAKTAESYEEDAFFVIDVSFFKTLHAELRGHTSSPALEEVFSEKLMECSMAYEGVRARADKAGVDLSGSRRTAANFPRFEDLKILDTPMVRTAYDVLVDSAIQGRAADEDFIKAAWVAMLLSSLPSTQNPVTIAVALVDIGLRGRTAEDLPWFERRLDEQVTEVLAYNSVYQPLSTSLLLQAHADFKPVFTGLGLLTLSGAETTVEEAVARKDKMSEDAFRSALYPPRVAEKLARATVLPALHTVGAPELELAFKMKLDDLAALLAQHTPPPLQKAPGFPPKGP